MRELSKHLMALEARRAAHGPREYVLRMLPAETAEQTLDRAQPRYPVVMIPTVAASAEAWVAMARGAA
jgi:hypothetical protein